jgi:hypothetical protein
MRYYKQFHGWPYVHLLALMFGGACLVPIFVLDDPTARVGLFVCAVFSLIAAWILWKGRRHYLEINRDWIVHHGFKQWRLKKTDLVRVECGRKGWVEDRDPYLTVHAFGEEHPVEAGFLINEARVEELIRAMRGTDDTAGA